MLVPRAIVGAKCHLFKVGKVDRHSAEHLAVTLKLDVHNFLVDWDLHFFANSLRGSDNFHCDCSARREISFECVSAVQSHVPSELIHHTSVRGIHIIILIVSLKEELHAMDAFIVGANVDFEGAHQGKIGKVEGIDLRNVREVCHLIVQGQVDIALVVLHTN